MSPLPLAAALVAAATLSPPANAAACAATAETPTAQHAFAARAAGAFRCDSARPYLEVTVCLELLGAVGWSPIACETFGADGAAEVSGEVYGCEYGFTVIRSAAYGLASTGEQDVATSLPVAYYCTPL